MAFGLDDLLIGAAVTLIGNAIEDSFGGGGSIPRDPLQERLVSEQLAQLQAMRQLAPLVASQQTLAGIAAAREAMEGMLREAARRQGLLGTVDSAALRDVQGRALAAFAEAVAQLRQQQPALFFQLLQGAQAPLAALQSLSAQRQALLAQEAAMQQAQQQAWGEMLGSVLAQLMTKPPKVPVSTRTSGNYAWNPDVSLKLKPTAPMGWEDRVRNQLRW